MTNTIDVAGFPDALVLFDGVCNFCSTGVNLALLLDRGGILRFTPIQSAYGRQLAQARGLDPDSPTTFIFFDNGVPLEKSAGALALAARLPATWRWAAVLARTPPAWRDRVYDWIAANRYRLLGRRKTCRLPSPAERARFILEPPPSMTGR